MSVDYNLTVRTNRLQQVVNAIDGGATNGWMRLLSAGGVTLSSLQLSRPMGTISGGILFFNGLSLIDPAASASGGAAFARIEDGGGTIVISGLTVGTGSSFEVVMSPTNVIVAGQTIAITQATITGN